MRRPKVKLDNLVAIITVAEKHDIDVAAGEMGLTASAVRKQIEVVESTLGVRLFEGKKGNLMPTEDGELFLVDAKRSVEHALLAEEKTLARQALRRHQFLIGHSTYLSPRLIALVNQIGIEDTPLIRIQHISGLTSAIVRRVLEGSLHAGFGFLPIPNPELMVHPIFEEPLVACIPSTHKLTMKPSIYPHDLEDEAIIAVAREPLPQLHQQIEEHFGEFGIKLHVVADAFAPPEALTYVAQKVGICLLARTSIVVQPGITVKPLSTRVLMRRSGIFIRADNRSPLVQKLSRCLSWMGS
ncbi:LysR family transcriptional regulator [Tunturibacter empetritectus]|uniref:DNA-binding transcriptional LysR family regulator n=1 Tax=Tunturiibacter lichenicola TaxID=2051959 RepID=A0A7W8J751_9BACT|nr:LysR family transcriptional regulator [Edaphobacter lichenicola]MBB5343780.1 DNA-binding transcriptional LysR family regulator [Edaphobacter lichenicola]